MNQHFWLQVDGAAWKDNKIVLNLAEFGSPSVIKNIIITYATQTNNKEKNVIELPLYSNSNRNIYICSLKIPTSSSNEMVILSGAALIVADT